MVLNKGDLQIELLDKIYANLLLIYLEKNKIGKYFYNNIGSRKVIAISIKMQENI